MFVLLDQLCLIFEYVHVIFLQCPAQGSTSHRCESAIIVDENKENEAANKIAEKLDKLSVAGDSKADSTSSSAVESKSTTVDAEKQTSSGDS